LLSIGNVWPIDGHLFAHSGAIAWPLGIALSIGLLRYFDYAADGDAWAAPSLLDVAHATTVWLATLVVAHELSWVGSHVGNENGIWRMAPWGAVPGMVLMTITAMAASPRWPMMPHRQGYLIIAVIPLAAWLLLWSLVANLASDADPMPLPYWPLVNPVDITEAVVLAAGAMWLPHLRRQDGALAGALPVRFALVLWVALLFVWLNALVLRSIHFWFDVAYTFDALWQSRLVQAVLSLLWTSLALGTVVLANRRQWRGAWIAGAALLAIVVAKLFFVDLSRVGGLERIISFIGVGLLLLLVGYLAPVPPKRASNLS